MSAAKGHDCVSVFMAMESRGVAFATGSKDVAAVSAFSGDLAVHGGDPGKDRLWRLRRVGGVHRRVCGHRRMRS
jgi:hypothetical protein